MCYVLLVE